MTEDTITATDALNMIETHLEEMERAMCDSVSLPESLVSLTVEGPEAATWRLGGLQIENVTRGVAHYAWLRLAKLQVQSGKWDAADVLEQLGIIDGCIMEEMQQAEAGEEAEESQTLARRMFPRFMAWMFPLPA